jgi:MFS family permease
MAVLTPSPMMVALVQTAASLPSVLLGLLAGALADMVERRRWLILTQFWLLCSSLLAAAVLLTGAITPWALLALTMLLGIGFALQAPASQAVIGEVVPPQDVPAALALGSVGYNVSRIVGPALAGLLIGLGGGTAVFAGVTLCVAVVFLIVLRWPGRSRSSSKVPAERLFAALRSGVRFVRHTPQCRSGLRHAFIFVGCGSAASALLPLLARDVLGMGAGGYGLLLGAFGLGGVASVPVLAPLRRRFSPGGLVATCALVFALVTVALAAPLTLPLAGAALVVGGAAWAAGATTIYASVQLALPDWVRARGVSIFNLVYALAMAGGAALWGWVTSLFGLQSALAVAAALMLLAAPWFRRMSPQSASAAPAQGPQVETKSLPALAQALRADPHERVLVQCSYRVRPEAVAEFLRAASPAGLAIRRNGARYWRLYRDLEKASTYVERYIVDSLSDLHRQVERMTPRDREDRQRLAAYLLPGVAPEVSLFASQELPASDEETTVF